MTSHPFARCVAGPARRKDGLLDAMNRKLVRPARLATGLTAEPTAEIFDSQSLKTTESGGVRGYAAGRRIKGACAVS